MIYKIKCSFIGSGTYITYVTSLVQRNTVNCVHMKAMLLLAQNNLKISMNVNSTLVSVGRDSVSTWMAPIVVNAMMASYWILKEWFVLVSID